MAIINKGMKRPNINTLFNSQTVEKASKEKHVTSGKELIKEYSIKDFPVDIEKFAHSLGITISYQDLNDDISGMLTKEGNTYVITVERKHSKNRQRFTIAHEIAHYFLHKNLKEKFEDTIFFRGVSKDSLEFQANLFAGEVLMPEEEFLRQLSVGNNKIETLAEYFGVSTLAIRVRAKQLNLQGHGL